MARAGLMSDGKIERDEFQQMLSPFLRPLRAASTRSNGFPACPTSSGRSSRPPRAAAGSEGFRITEEDAKRSRW